MKKNRKKGLIFTFAGFIVIGIAIAANIFVTKLDWTYDVTKNNIYTLSQQTEKILKNNEQKITFYILSSKTDFNDVYQKITSQYSKKSKNISIEYKNPEDYPEFASDYVQDEDDTSGGIIVVCGEKSRFISQDEFYETSYDENYNQTTSITLESKLTEAINYVCSDETPVIYTLSGHGEMEFTTKTEEYFKGDNYEIKDLTLLTEEKVPDDCAILFINAPTNDLNKEDAKKIKTYMKNGGKLFYVAGDNGDELTQFQKLIGTYAVTVEKGIIVEGNSQNYMQMPTYLLPEIASSDITKSMENTYVLAPVSKGLTIADDTGNYTVTSLLNTSDQAYAKTNTKSNVVEKEKGDVSGLFSLAAYVEDEDGAKAVILACQNMLEEQIDTYVSGMNSDFVLNCVNALTGQENKISIRAKSLDSSTVTVPAFDQKMWMMITVFVIPAALLLTGIVICVRRKYR